MNLGEFKNEFQKIRGKTIAVVYTFEGDTTSGFEHFFMWKSSILTKWLIAIEQLHCMPLILDVRTFVDKAINQTLPYIDYVLNLNTGMFDLSVMALVPSMCSSLKIPCIPCDAVSIVTGENKLLSNLIAKSIGIQVPRTIDTSISKGIFRPINLGNSLGVKRGMKNSCQKGIYQEFISGYEITTPVVYNALTHTMDLLPTVIYIHESKDLDWFNGEEEKKARTGYFFKTVKLDETTNRKYLELIDIMGIQTYCRIDARIKCSENIYHDNSNNTVAFDDVYFIEINVMPTIRDKNNFTFSFDSIGENDSLYPCIKAQEDIVGDINVFSFLLASSMLSFI
ncbi:MAG: hypothetical protein HFF36_12490 [Coprobacillus sp.]|nr:hypothetical protein [Coprobacillus sp.]